MHAVSRVANLRLIGASVVILLALPVVSLYAEEPKPPETKEADVGASAVATGEAGDQADKVLLQFKYKPGQVARYEVVHEMEITTLFNDAKEITKNKSNTKRSYKVRNVTPEGDGDLQLTIDWVQMRAVFDSDGNLTKIDFQSDDPTKHPREFKAILEMVGKPTATIRFDRSGRIISVDEANAVRPKAAAGVVKRAGGLPVNPLHTGLADATPESYLVRLPEEPVVPGNTWKEPFYVTARDEQNLPTKIKMQRNYTFASLENGLATIEFRTITLSPNLSPSVEAQMIQRETRGNIVFDVERGVIVAHDSQVEKQVIEPFGPKSSMYAKSKYHEKLVSEETSVAQKPAEESETRK